MPVSQNQRLRKAAAKAAKRKAAVAEKLAEQRRELAISKPRHINLAASPIVACTLSEDYEERGMGMLTVTRKLSLGRFAITQFLLDAWCLGVKDAYFRVVEGDEYEDFAEELEIEGGPAPMLPARARKLLRDAAAYGASNGIPQPDDLPEMERMFGDVQPDPEATFAFGDRGRPHYVVGPHDTLQRQKFILARLEEKFGPDGFEISAETEFDEEDEAQYDYVDENGEIIKGATISDEEIVAAIAEIERDPELLAELEQFEEELDQKSPPKP